MKDNVKIEVNFLPFCIIAVAFMLLKYFGVAFMDTPYWVAFCILSMPVVIVMLFLGIYTIWGVNK